MIVCCPACDQALPIRWILFQNSTVCPHCQARLEGSWVRWSMIQLVSLLFTLRIMDHPPGDWLEVFYQIGSLILLMGTLSILVPGQYRIKPPELETEGAQ